MIIMESFTLEYIGVKSPVINANENVFEIFIELLSERNDLTLESGDLVVIASKVVAMEQNRIINLEAIEPSQKAIDLASKSNLNPSFVEIVLRESDVVIGAVPGALLTLRNGDVNANAGIDKSNAGLNKAILLPDNPDQYSSKFKKALEEKYHITDVGVIIADSTTRPLRIGTVGSAIGTAGFPAIVDIRGQEDLFGYKMSITLRNIADNIASGANVIMGESAESIPFVIVKGLQIQIKNHHWEEKSLSDLRIDPEKCLYFGNMHYTKL